MVIWYGYAIFLSKSTIRLLPLPEKRDITLFWNQCFLLQYALEMAGLLQIKESFKQKHNHKNNATLFPV